MTEEKLCGGKTFKEVMAEVNFHIHDKHKIEQLEKENAELKAQLTESRKDFWRAVKNVGRLRAQIEKMKPYCKELCKNRIKTEFLGNDCYYGVCRNCDKWELKEN